MPDLFAQLVWHFRIGIHTARLYLIKNNNYSIDKLKETKWSPFSIFAV